MRDLNRLFSGGLRKRGSGVRAVAERAGGKEAKMEMEMKMVIPLVSVVRWTGLESCQDDINIAVHIDVTSHIWHAYSPTR